MTCLQHTAEQPLGFPLTDEEMVGFVDRHSLEFPTDVDCFEGLVSMLDREGMIQCSRGHKADIRRREPGERTCKCGCGEIVWITAGTFLHGIKEPRAWHFGLWLREQGVSVSSNKFADLIGIRQSSAWNLLKKISTVILGQMPEETLSLYSGAFLKLYSKRSTETPARQHPEAEQSVADQEAGIASVSPGTQSISGSAAVSPEVDKDQNAHANPSDQRLDESENEEDAWRQSISDADGASSELDFNHDDTHAHGDLSDETVTLDEREILLLSFISNQEIHFDKLCRLTGLPTGEVSACLTLLEIAGKIERLVGDYFVLLQEPVVVVTEEELRTSEEQQELIEEFAEFIEFVFNSVSRKHLQSYVADFWFFTNRKRWGKQELSKACMRHGQVREEQFHVVTPLMVRIMPLAS